MSEKKIKRALISVYNKDGLDKIVRKLEEHGIEIISTGGTQEYIQKLGINCTSIEDITTYPSILGGRVKTLHPQIFGAILARKDNDEDIRQCEMYGIAMLDLVIVDLYPFMETVQSGATHQEIIEKIDIGGVSLIRAAAKNYNNVVIIPSREYYNLLTKILDDDNATTTLNLRESLAKMAYAYTSKYDHEVQKYFSGETVDDLFPENEIQLFYPTAKTLRYGENSHQNAVYYGTALNERFDILGGKELSYNNLLDIDAAAHLMEDFEEPTVAILKHNTPCGVASHQNIDRAFEKALQSDPLSAFGGVIIINETITKDIALKLNNIFFEVLIGPEFTEEAINILKQKPSRILLKDKIGFDVEKNSFRSILGGLLIQQRDLKIESIADLTATNQYLATDDQISDLIFAMKVVKHSKSNAITLVKDKQLIGVGSGQTSRIDALKQAIAKAKEMNFDINGSVLASDAFFPFADCVELATDKGISAIIQPGGSIRDNDSIIAAKDKGVPMYLTGIRHFKH